MTRARRSITASASRYFARDVGERLRRQRRHGPVPGVNSAFLSATRSRCCLQLVVVLEVDLFLALLGLVQRRLRDVDVAAVDQLGHVPVEERQQQRADVRAVDVGVGHDDDAVVAQLVGGERVLVIGVLATRLADAGAERGDQRGDRLGRQHLVETRALDVQDLAAQRQDRLELAIAALLGRAAGGVALDEVDLAQRRIASPGSRRACRAAPCRRARPCGA